MTKSVLGGIRCWRRPVASAPVTPGAPLPFDFHGLEDLARGLSRRETLRRLGAGFAGALLACLGIGPAWGQASNDCADFCTAVFPPGPDRGQCVSDAAQGTGLCP